MQGNCCREDVRFASEMERARRFVFLGKAAIYSAHHLHERGLSV
jgi:hypothetical protein